MNLKINKCPICGNEAMSWGRSKYCFAHRSMLPNKYGRFHGKHKIHWSDIHGSKFQETFDKEFGLKPIEVKE